jgi:hypothetical protein
MKERLLSVQPVADDYRISLAADLEQATIIRFAMAYISQDGLNALGMERLRRALLHSNSFGVATLSCGCGYEPLMQLQERIGSEDVRLKYFVDPQVGGRDLAEPSMELMHSKMVYLVCGNRAVIYMGSHNWSGRALGHGQPRNAEGSLRLEYKFDEKQLEGRGSDLPSRVNKHLNYIWKLSICRSATQVNRALFEQWHHLCCERSRSDSDRNSYAVVSAVCQVNASKAHRTAEFWCNAMEEGVGIYFQLHEEQEGQVLRSHQDRVLILAWIGEVELRSSQAPVLLFCKSTRSNAGPGSELHGQSGGDITHFRWVLWDSIQHRNTVEGRDIGQGQIAKVRTGRAFRYFDLNLVPQDNLASAVDQGIQPKYQHYLQVEEVFLPQWLDPEDNHDQLVEELDRNFEDPRPKKQRRLLRWLPGDLAFSKKKNVPKQKLPGYQVDEETCRAILKDLEAEFHLKKHRKKAKALPFMGETSGREGRRVSAHPLHEALMDEEANRNPRTIYARRKLGAVIPDLDHSKDDVSISLIDRVQPVFADSLESIRRRLMEEEPS